MSRYRQMTVFLAVAETLSLAAAAKHLHLSSATVTRAVDALENRLGIPLLQRSTQGVTLTAAGEQFRHDSQRILGEVWATEASARGLHHNVCGRINLSMPLLFGQFLFTPVLLEYLTQYPQVQICVQYQEHCPNLHEEGVDVAVAIGPLPDSSLFAIKVGSTRPVICTSPAYLLAHGEPQHPSELRTHSIIHTSSDAQTSEWTFRQGDQPLSVRVAPRLRYTTSQAAIIAACQGAGLARCMAYQVHEQLGTKQLRSVLAPYAPADLDIHLVYREGRRATERVRSFIDFVVARLRQHPALNEATLFHSAK